MHCCISRLRCYFVESVTLKQRPACSDEYSIDYNGSSPEYIIIDPGTIGSDCGKVVSYFYSIKLKDGNVFQGRINMEPCN